MALNWNLRYYFKLRCADTWYQFRIFRKVGQALGEPYFALPLQNIGVKFDKIPELYNGVTTQRNVLWTNTDLENTWGLEVGNTLYIENSNSNDGRAWYVDEFYATGDATYPYGIKFSFNEGWAFTSETDTCDIWIERAKNVTSFEPITKWGEEVTLDGDLTPKFSSVFTSNTDINLLDETGSDYAEIATNDPGMFKLEIYKGALNYTTPFWTGLSLPDVHSRRIVGQNYLTSFRFNDGLALAKRKRFYVDDPDTDMTWMEVLVQCFAEGCQVPLGIRENLNIYETGMNDDLDDSPIDQSSINPQRYYTQEATFIDPIENICKELGARIFQWDNKWVIQRIQELSGEYYYRNYESDGTFTSGQWVAKTPTVIDKVYGNREANFILSQPASKNVILSYDNPYKENFSQLNLIENGFFEKWTGSVPDGWTVVSTNNPPWSVSRSTDSETGRYAVDMETKTGYNGVPVSNNYLETTFGQPNGGYDLDIVLKPLHTESERNYNKIGNVSCVWTVDRDGYFWNAKDKTWGASQHFNEVSVEYYPLSPDYIHATFEITQDDHPVQVGISPLRLRVYEVQPDLNGGTVLIDRVTAVVIQTSETDSDGNQVFRPELYAPKVASNRESNPLVVRNGDIDISVYMPLSFSSLWLERLPDFVAKTRKSLGVNLVDNVSDESDQQTNILNIDIKTTVFDLDIPIELEGDRYVQNGITKDYVNSRWNGQFVQLISQPKYFR